MWISTVKKRPIEFDESLLISALSKYWRPLSFDEYMNRMDMIDVQNAIGLAGIPEEIRKLIWKPIGDKSYMEMMKRGRAENGK